jgi:hypothetical protein
MPSNAYAQLRNNEPEHEGTELTEVVVADTATAGNWMHINVRELSGKTSSVRVPNLPSTSGAQLKAGIQVVEGLAPRAQRLIFGGRELLDSDMLHARGVEDGYTVHLLIRRNLPPEDAVAASVPGHVDPGDAAAGVQSDANSGQLPIAAPVQDQSWMDGWTDVSQVYLIARGVRWFAVLDGIFLFLSPIPYPSWFLVVGILLCFAGYWGARLYRFYPVLAYAIFEAAIVGYRIGFMAQPDNDSFSEFMLVFGLLIQLYILWLLYKFLKSLRQLREEDRTTLLNWR